MLSVSRVEMRRRVVIEEQLDDDAVEAAELNLAGLQVRKHVLWRLSRKLQIKRVRAEVQTGTPANRAILSEMNGFEGPRSVPGLENPSTGEMREVDLTLHPVRVAKPNSEPRPGEDFDRFEHDNRIVQGLRSYRKGKNLGRDFETAYRAPGSPFPRDG